MQDVSIALLNMKAITRIIGVWLSIRQHEARPKTIISFISHATRFKILHVVRYFTFYCKKKNKIKINRQINKQINK